MITALKVHFHRTIGAFIYWHNYVDPKTESKKQSRATTTSNVVAKKKSNVDKLGPSKPTVFLTLFICNSYSFILCHIAIVFVLWRLWDCLELSTARVWGECLHLEDWQSGALHHTFNASKWWAGIPLSSLLPQERQTDTSESFLWINLNNYWLTYNHIVHYAPILNILHSIPPKPAPHHIHAYNGSTGGVVRCQLRYQPVSRGLLRPGSKCKPSLEPHQH